MHYLFSPKLLHASGKSIPAVFSCGLVTFAVLFPRVSSVCAWVSASLAAFAWDLVGGVGNLSRSLRALRLRVVGGASEEAPSIDSEGHFTLSVSPCMLALSATKSPMLLPGKSAFCS